MDQRRLDFGGEPSQPGVRAALTVSALTERIQGLLETELFDVWVQGEVSNVRFATSGHWYFSLKDERAQVAAVVWRTAARLIRFRPEDGMQVIARGSLRVYPPRGSYQVSVEVLEPLGKGSLQEAFEQLKRKLAREGLFEPGRKRRLPLLPRRIGVVTSPTGAAIRDILQVLGRRYRNLEVLVYPARVQGPEAAGEVAAGIRALNRLEDLDVILLARGGGSLEDLWAFNDEQVARAIAGSRLPVLSGIGHETDATIADFVADARAPTPSAAAETVVQAKVDLTARIATLDGRIRTAARSRLASTRARVEAVTSHRVFAAEQGRLRSSAQAVDELTRRSELALERRRERARAALQETLRRLEAFRFDRQLAARRERLAAARERLARDAAARIERSRAALGRRAAQLDSLSPVAVLGRGYALVWNAERRELLRDAGSVSAGDVIHVRLHRGSLDATVTSKESP